MQQVTANPNVTVKDSMEFFNVSEATAKRYRHADYLYIQKKYRIKESAIRLNHFIECNSYPPPSLAHFVTNN